MKTRAAWVVLVGLAGCVLQADPGGRGPMGDPGSMGDPGLQGDAGPMGDDGVPGLQGDGGPKGDKGEQGIQGPPGVSPFKYAPNLKDIYYPDGRVGIGTMGPPSSALDVEGSDSNVAYLELGKTSGAASSFGDWVALDFRHTNELAQATGSPAARISAVLERGGNGYGLGIWTRSDAATLTEAVRVNADGNVGVGTVSPSYPLEVAGTSALGDRSIVVGHGNEIWTQPQTNAPADLAINFRGYADAFAQARNLWLGDGKQGLVMYVNGNTGRVGIGTNNPATKLEVFGSVNTTDKYYANGVCVAGCSSDARLKQAIAPLPAPLTRLLQLRGVTYEWKDLTRYGNRRGPQIGMIAQEVEQVFPSWVGTDADGYKTLTYRGFEALTVESLRELKTENDRLKTENGQLAGKLTTLEERLAALEKRGGVQHASVFGDGRWFGGAMFGAAVVLAPWWMRRRRRGQG